MTALAACYIKNHYIVENLKKAGVWKIPIEDLLLTDENLRSNGLTSTTVQLLRRALDRKARIDAALARPRCGCGRQMGQDKLQCQQCDIEADARSETQAQYDEIMNAKTVEDLQPILLRLAGLI